MAVAALVAAIDACAPWLAPYRGLIEALRSRDFAGLSVPDALNRLGTDRDPVVRFVPHTALPAGEPYEAYIRRSGTVPTRDNRHDLFNGLVWLRHPGLKQRLNALQSAHMAGEPIGSRRGAVRDALTLFDENAALWHAPQALIDALARRDWHALFVTHRDLWREARLTLIGHALMDKLCRPHKAITAHVWVAAVPTDAAGLDELLHPAALAAKPWLPLPVLGVPGWWPANEAVDFYADEGVFRPGPMKNSGPGAAVLWDISRR